MPEDTYKAIRDKAKLFDMWAWSGMKPVSSYEKIRLWNDLHGGLRTFSHSEPLQTCLQEMYRIFTDEYQAGRVNVSENCDTGITNSLG